MPCWLVTRPSFKEHMASPIWRHSLRQKIIWWWLLQTAYWNIRVECHNGNEISWKPYSAEQRCCHDAAGQRRSVWSASEMGRKSPAGWWASTNVESLLPAAPVAGWHAEDKIMMQAIECRFSDLVIRKKPPACLHTIRCSQPQGPYVRLERSPPSQSKRGKQLRNVGLWPQWGKLPMDQLRKTVQRTYAAYCIESKR